MKVKAAIVIVIFVAWLLYTKEDSVTYGPGVMAANTPAQQAIKKDIKFSFNDFAITPLATFEITAKVLAKENYHFDQESNLSPTDLALGWGRMSDQSIIDQLTISQANRWYRWNTKSNAFPIPRREIEISSANMHLVPKNDQVSAELKSVKKGHIVTIKGYLIRADSQDNNWHWKSSLTRNDTGAGACELIFVESLKIE